MRLTRMGWADGSNRPKFSLCLLNLGFCGYGLLDLRKKAGCLLGHDRGCGHDPGFLFCFLGPGDVSRLDRDLGRGLLVHKTGVLTLHNLAASPVDYNSV